MVRIRYFKNEMNQVVSKPMLVGNDMQSAVVNLVDFSYNLVDVDGNVIFSGTATSLPDAQKKLKHALKALGVMFNDEVRNREVQDSASPDIVYSTVGQQ